MFQNKKWNFQTITCDGSFQYNPEILRKIKAQALIIHGNQDPIFHSDCGKDIADLIPDSEFILIDGMGHSIPEELFGSIAEKVIQNIRK